MHARAHDPRAVVVYDNINFMDRKRHEDAGHTASYRAFTNAAFVVCDELPADGLTQDMHNPSIPLSLRDIATSPALTGGDDIGRRVSSSLIADAVQRLYPEGVKAVFDRDGDSSYPAFPVIEQLPPRVTQYWQFAGIPQDEGTIEGTYAVHEDIFLRQLGLKAADKPGEVDDFTRRLVLCHGDQLTDDRIRSTLQEQRRAELPYDRRQWIRPLPAWFHVQMNLLATIVRTHWAADPGFHNVHSLVTDMTRWNRSHGTRDNAKYHLMEPVVAQGFTSRVGALFCAAMRDRGLLPVDTERNPQREVVGNAVSRLSAPQFVELVEDVRSTAFTLSAWTSSSPDVDFRTMCRLLQEVELFLTLRHAVKYGDIGMLRRLVDPLIIVFLGAKQHNYGREMLYYRWCLSSANTPVLQRSILSSGLVNWHGRQSTFKAIDLHLEHLNCSCKLDLRNQKNSTHDFDIVFQRQALCNAYLGELRTKLERWYGESMSGKHTSDRAIHDMFFLSWNLFLDGHASRRASVNAGSRMYDSADIRQDGMDSLEANVDAFNARHVYTPTSLPHSTLAVTPSDGYDGFVDISEYADLAHSGYDGQVDATADEHLLTGIDQLDLTQAPS